jgi:hypothetical protein
MKTTFRILLAIIIGFAFTMATGCATKPKMHQTGFLKDYSQLKENPKGLVQWTYFKKDGVDFGAYDKVIVDYITFFFKEDAKYKGIHPEELIELAQYFNNAYVEALSGAYSFTDKPGPGVLRLRTAITDLVPGKPVSGTMSSIMPPALIASYIKKATTGSHIGMGQLSGEAELIDSQTGEILAQAIDTEMGKKYKLGKSFTKWGQVKGITKDWAESFRKSLDKLSGRE